MHDGACSVQPIKQPRALRCCLLQVAARHYCDFTSDLVARHCCGDDMTIVLRKPNSIG